MNENKFKYKQYLKSEYWQGIREQILKRDKYKCRACGYNDKLHVHHRTYEFIGNEDLDELITLCKKCHNIFHKINPEVNYTSYYHNKKLESMLKEKRINDAKYKEFVNNNLDKFSNILDFINNNYYIKLKDFLVQIKYFANKDFDFSTYAGFCLDYFDLVYIHHCSKEFKKQYNFPKNLNTNSLILVKREFYKQNKENLFAVIRVYSLDTIDLKTIFRQY